MTLKRIFVEYPHYVISLIAISLVLSGLLFMMGECSTNENFCPGIFSARRVIIAPILCLVGYLLLIPAIVWHGNASRGS